MCSKCHNADYSTISKEPKFFLGRHTGHVSLGTEWVQRMRAEMLCKDEYHKANYGGVTEKYKRSSVTSSFRQTFNQSVLSSEIAHHGLLPTATPGDGYVCLLRVP